MMKPKSRILTMVDLKVLRRYILYDRLLVHPWFIFVGRS
jgi:hypothetical protein